MSFGLSPGNFLILPGFRLVLV